MRKTLLIVLTAMLLTAAASLSASATTNGSASASGAPGVSKTSIKLGGTFPLSGVASIYAPIPRGMDAYFKYVNSRKGPDGKKGVYGRKISWKYYDDGYNPAQTVQLTHKLVLEDKVFAVVGSLGTEHNQAIRPFMNERKVPQLLVSSGASFFGSDRRSSRGPSAGSRTTSRRAASMPAGSRATRRAPRSPSSTRTTTTGRTISRASRKGSATRRA